MNIERAIRLSAFALIATSGLVATDAATSAQATNQQGEAAAAAETSGKPTISWQSCGDADWVDPEKHGQFRWLQCGEIQVPLDHSNPNGETATLRMTKQRGGRQATKTLFLNRGPVGTPATFDVGLPHSLGGGIFKQYSFVSVYPRGVGYSDGFHCAETTSKDYGRVNTFPMTNAEVSARVLDDFAFRRECAGNNPRLAKFMTTADHARDLDLIRQAVGDDTMNILGMQYGAHVAATYRNVFPSRPGRIVMDPPFNSAAWTRPDSFFRMDTPALARTKGVYAGKRGMQLWLSAKDWERLSARRPRPCVRTGNTSTESCLLAT